MSISIIINVMPPLVKPPAVLISVSTYWLSVSLYNFAQQQLSILW